MSRIRPPCTPTSSCWTRSWDLASAPHRVRGQLPTLGIFWNAQQTQLNQFARVDRNLTWIHIVFLAPVAMMPFSTLLPSTFETLQVALIVYWLNLLAAGIVLYISWTYATRAVCSSRMSPWRSAPRSAAGSSPPRALHDLPVARVHRHPDRHRRDHPRPAELTRSGHRLSWLPRLWRVPEGETDDARVRAADRHVARRGRNSRSNRRWRSPSDAKVERLGAFIVFRSVGQPAEVPDTISIIGGAPARRATADALLRLSRVERLFLTKVEGSTWTIWRAPGEDWNGPDGPGFNQRFIGEISADGGTIEGRWERGMGTPATHWELDFPIDYVRT